MPIPKPPETIGRLFKHLGNLTVPSIENTLNEDSGCIYMYDILCTIRERYNSYRICVGLIEGLIYIFFYFLLPYLLLEQPQAPAA